jgi:hypothetical protein
LDIKNVSCGNLTTGEGRRGARCGRRFARKAREGCVKKHGRNEREEEPPGGRADRDRGRGGEEEEEGGGSAVCGLRPRNPEYENFYDFYALAPAHLEIRFNSLNFKKLPPLPLAPSAADRAAPDPSHRSSSPSYLFFPPRPAPVPGAALCLSSVPSSYPEKRNCAALHRRG